MYNLWGRDHTLFILAYYSKQYGFDPSCRNFWRCIYSTIQSTSIALLDIPMVVLSIPYLVSIEVWLTAVGVSAQAQYACLRLFEYIWQLSICQCHYTAISMDTWGGAITPSAGQQTYSARQNKCWRPSNQATMKYKKGECEFGEALGKLFGRVNVWVSLQEWDIFPFIENHHYIKFYVLPIHIPNENWELLHIAVVPG